MARGEGEYKGKARRYIFALAERQLQSPPLTVSIINALKTRQYFPDQPFEVIVGLCPVGLREARTIDFKQLRQALWDLAGLNPSAPLKLVALHEL